ncbi:MAG: MCE family protein [Gemmatimonadetes bacterium]|nr:MAG: MCE family protein [Gemmatimonadota bacterium]
MAFTYTRYDRVVGVFVGVALLVVGFMLVYVAWRENWFEPKYTYYAILNDGYGLQEGSGVRFEGIDGAGRVLSVKVVGSNHVEIKLQLRARYADQLRQDSVLKLASVDLFTGVLGARVIDISAGSYLSPLIEPGGVITRVGEPTGLIDLAVKDIDFVQLSENLQRLLVNLVDVTDTLMQNSDNVGRLIETTDALVYQLYTVTTDTLDSPLKRWTTDLATMTGQASLLMARMTQLTENIEVTLENTNLVMGETSILIDQMQVLIASTDSLMANMNQMVANMEQLMADLQPATPEIPELIDQTHHLLDETDELVRAMKRNWLIRQTLDAAPPTLHIDPNIRDQIEWQHQFDKDR